MLDGAGLHTNVGPRSRLSEVHTKIYDSMSLLWPNMQQKSLQKSSTSRHNESDTVQGLTLYSDLKSRFSPCKPNVTHKDIRVVAFKFFLIYPRDIQVGYTINQSIC